ncbi:MAG: PilN domain-containing protein [Dehalococcoidia bacterium]|nr:PilN domain-containing protein [Dehalococcoidia bacterium]
MNVDINLIPAELRAQPPVKSRTLVMILLVLVLAAAGFFLWESKNSAQSASTTLEKNIAALNAERNTLAGNKEANDLIKSINNKKTMATHHQAFLASRVNWGDALARAQSYVPQGVMVSKITQKDAFTLEIAGSATSYTAVSSYFKLLNSDPVLSQAGVPPSWKESQFTILLRVAPRGGA